MKRINDFQLNRVPDVATSAASANGSSQSQPIKTGNTLLPDWIIEGLCKGDNPMIHPFVPHKQSIVEIEDEDGVATYPAISFGLSSYGYDVRLSDRSFVLFVNNAAEVDPKNFNPRSVVNLPLFDDKQGQGSYFLMPPQSYALGVSLERFQIPGNIAGICLGKSTYARSGIHINTTPLEPGWSGHLTLEIQNCLPTPARVYTNEGIAQILFFSGEECQETYAGGKYQNQPQRVVYPRV